MRGQLLYYRSRLDDQLQPLPVCATGDGPGPKALILDLSPGAIADLNGSIRRCEALAGWAAKEGAECVIAKPCGRGPGTVYQGPGEVDLFEAMDVLCDVFPIDRDRISVTGGSMGGAATWYIASHYPDRFAAGAPFCGYCDYRLWTKPGGYIMRMQPWEELSWQSRGAAFRAENLGNMGIWITHGEWDIGIGGGVPVQHSRNMSQALNDLGIEHTYVEVPHCGHGCMMEETTRPVLKWLCEQRRVAQPQHIRLVVHGLRHNRSHWVEVQQLVQYGKPGKVEATLAVDSNIVVTTENVRRIAFGPLPGRKAMRIELDGQTFRRVSLSARPASFENCNGRWQRTRPAAEDVDEKHHGASGPVGDLFFEPMRLVKGTAGSDHESAIIEWMTGAIPGYFKKENGGVHRGIFSGESWYDIPVIADTDIAEDEMENCNLLLLGTPKSNKVLARFAEALPLEIGNGEIRLGEKTFRGKHLGVSACFRSPRARDRIVVVTAGVTPEALTGATHLNLQLLPDYLVWDGDQVLDYGFSGNAWEVA